MHFLAEPRLAAAVRNYLEGERHAIAHEVAWLDARSPLKR
jgi:predicted N-acyltransferase